MASDVVFKTKAFGGFNKDEVMDFVNRVLAEKSDLEKKVAETNADLAKARSELEEYKSVADDNAQLSGQLEQANQLVSQYEEKISVKEDEISELNAEIASKDIKISDLSSQVAQSYISEETQAELDSLRAEVTRLKAECEKKRDLERQVGAAMLDARVHSEELVEAAKQKANSVTKSVYSAIGETALKIDDLSSGIGEIARSFTKSVEEVELRIKALTGDMSKTAQLLISESGIITESQTDSVQEVEYDFLTSKNETLTDVDDGVSE